MSNENSDPGSAPAPAGRRDYGPTDAHKFDVCLKKNLWGDLGYRCVIWFGAPSLVAAFALRGSGVSVAKYASGVVDKIGPPLDMVGVTSMALCTIALWLKDLAHCASPTVVRRADGYVAGIVRRTAGDVSLWVLGGLSTLIATFVLAWIASGVRWNELGAALAVLVKLAVFWLTLGLLNVLVRRGPPTPLARHKHLGNPRAISTFYALVLVAMAGSLWAPWLERAILCGAMFANIVIVVHLLRQRGPLPEQRYALTPP